MLLIDLITSQQIDLITTTHCLHGSTVSAIAAVEKYIRVVCLFKGRNRRIDDDAL
jgi:hypothetical protein